MLHERFASIRTHILEKNYDYADTQLTRTENELERVGEYELTPYDTIALRMIRNLGSQALRLGVIDMFRKALNGLSYSVHLGEAETDGFKQAFTGVASAIKSQGERQRQVLEEEKVLQEEAKEEGVQMVQAAERSEQEMLEEQEYSRRAEAQIINQWNELEAEARELNLPDIVRDIRNERSHLRRELGLGRIIRPTWFKSLQISIGVYGRLIKAGRERARRAAKEELGRAKEALRRAQETFRRAQEALRREEEARRRAAEEEEMRRAQEASLAEARAREEAARAREEAERAEAAERRRVAEEMVRRWEEPPPHYEEVAPAYAPPEEEPPAYE